MDGIHKIQLSSYVLLILTVFFPGAKTHSSTDMKCREPANYTDVIEYAIDSLYTGSSFVHEMTSLISQQTESTLSTSGEKLTIDAFLEENEYSCPWKWRVNIDPDRIPTSIYFADCACAYCQRRSTEDCLDRLGKYGQCRPVYGPMLVVKRYCDVKDGVFSYEARLQNIARGCTCQRNMLIN